MPGIQEFLYEMCPGGSTSERLLDFGSLDFEFGTIREFGSAVPGSDLFFNVIGNLDEGFDWQRRKIGFGSNQRIRHGFATEQEYGDENGQKVVMETGMLGFSLDGQQI